MSAKKKKKQKKDKKKEGKKEEIKKGNNLINDITNLQELLNDFKGFINQYAIFSLALGIVIGNLTQGTVKSLVEGLITPLINVILKIFFSNLGEIGTWSFTVMNDITFKPGIIIKAFLEFITILFIIFLTIKKVLNKPELLEKKK